MFDEIKRLKKNIYTSLIKEEMEGHINQPIYEDDRSFLNSFQNGEIIKGDEDLTTAERLARVGLVRFGAKVEFNPDKKTIEVRRTLKTTERGRGILKF